MRDLKERLHRITDAELSWPFGQEPSFTIKGPKSSYGHQVKIDPFPCYGHDMVLVEEIAEQVEACFPMDVEIDYFVAEFEAMDRCNGFAQRDYDYSGNKEPYPWEPMVCLSGKRIPLHPAMTRYLVPHEVGHIAQWWIEKLRGLKDDELRKQYQQLRPETNFGYGGRKWHANVGELIANDFRILVCGLETEFWPHPGFARPDEVLAVVEFWEKAVAENFSRVEGCGGEQHP